MIQNNFWSRHRSAKDAGLNDEWALKVAYGCIDLDEALGGMDHQSESRFDENHVVSAVSYQCRCTMSEVCQACKDEIPF